MTKIWTREEIENLARQSLLGKKPKKEVMEICKFLECTVRGSKEYQIKKIHDILGIPFNETQYNAIGWVTTNKIVTKKPKILGFTGTYNEQIEEAKEERVKVNKEMKELVNTIRPHCETIFKEESLISLEEIDALEEACKQFRKSFQRLTERLNDIDHTIRELISQKSELTLSCPICMDDSRKQFKCMNPCGHIVCNVCFLRIQRCPKCCANIEEFVNLYT